MAKEDVVGERDQRSPLPAGSKVGAAKIRDDLATGFVCQKRGIEPLDGVGRIVEERLTMRRDGGDLVGLQLGDNDCLVHRRGGCERDLSAEFRQAR